MSDILLVLGAAAVTAGLGLAWAPLGVVALGAFLLLAGVASYRPPKNPQE